MLASAKVGIPLGKCPKCGEHEVSRITRKLDPMELIKTILKHPRFIRFVIASVAVVVVALLAAHYLGLDWERVKETLVACWTFIEANPWALFLSIVILPALPFPMSILLLSVGVAWKDWPLWQACSIALLGVALNMTWTYFIAAYPARKLIDKWLKYTKFTIPELGRKDYVGLIFLLRATPGIPLFIHNYILGFLRVPFFVYLPLSIVISGCYIVGIIIFGASILEGSWGKIATSIGLLVIAGLVTKSIRKHYGGKTVDEDKTSLIEKENDLIAKKIEVEGTPNTETPSEYLASPEKTRTDSESDSSKSTSSYKSNDI